MVVKQSSGTCVLCGYSAPKNAMTRHLGARLWRKIGTTDRVTLNDFAGLHS